VLSRAGAHPSTPPPETRGADMATDAHHEAKSDIAKVDPAQPDNLDPRDTEHPTGAKQAAENAANDPPS
jgi:hypothetical protein